MNTVESDQSTDLLVLTMDRSVVCAHTWQKIVCILYVVNAHLSANTGYDWYGIGALICIYRVHLFSHREKVV